MAQERMKKYADLRRLERQFEVGDWVYLRLQPYKELSVAGHKPHELSPKYYGPYKITHKIGEVAFRIELPASTKIHCTFHVSQLKRKLGS